MKLAVIDTNEDFAKILYQKLGKATDSKILSLRKKKEDENGDIVKDENGSEVTESKTCSEIAQEIIGDGKDDELVIFININGEVENAKRQEQKGVDILKWLRLKQYNNHCVMYSFLALEKLVKHNPLNTILLSKGVSFIHLPYSFQGLSTFEKAERENLLPYFRAHIDLISVKHEQANHYGLIKLYEAYDFLYQITTTHNLSKPEIIYEVLKYTNEPTKTLEWKSEKYEEKFRAITNRKKRDNKFNIIKEAHLKDVYFDFVKEQIKELRKNPRVIIYIDDKAKKWSKFLRLVLYENEQPNNSFIEIIPIDGQNSEDIIKLYIEKIKDLDDNGKSVDLVISDLRLFEYENHIYDYREFQSYRVIKHIKNNYKTKLLLFTASNKLSVYKTMIELNKKYVPNAIFIKEGADLAYTTEQSIENFFNLIDSLYSIILLDQKSENIEATDIVEVYSEYWAKDQIKELETLSLSNSDKKKLAFQFNKFTHIVIDTNIFISSLEKGYYLKLKYLLTELKNKIKIHYTVWFELKRNASLLMSEKRYLSQYFLNFIDRSMITEEVIEPVQINELEIIMKNNFKTARDLRDLADSYLVKYIMESHKTSTANILFLTYDYKDSKTQVKKGPGRRIKEWLTGEKIQSVCLLQQKDKNLELFYFFKPEQRKTG